MKKRGEELKQKTEEILGCEISDERFEQAFEYAKRKQAYIYGREGRNEVLTDRYLAKLTAESAVNLALQRLTVFLNKKECLTAVE